MNQRGFTLIELVMVLVLIGIIALFAAPRLGNMPTTKAFSFADKLRADIRYAQNLAMTRNQRYRVYVNSSPAPAGPGGGYAVVYDTSGGSWSSFGYAQDPAGTGNLSVVLDAGDYAGITVSPNPNTFIEFDSLGRPAGGTTLTVSPGGATVTVIDETGAVN